MLTNEELIELYEKAYESHHVVDIANYAECSSECDECPAVMACEQLAEDTSYSAFKLNFSQLVKGTKYEH